MPQMKKVAMVVGNNLIYTDTYSQALAQLGGATAPAQAQGASPLQASAEAPASPAAPSAAAPATAAAANGDPRITEIGDRLRKYRELVSRGRLSDAGRELEAIQAIVDRK